MEIPEEQGSLCSKGCNTGTFVEFYQPRVIYIPQRILLLFMIPFIYKTVCDYYGRKGRSVLKKYNGNEKNYRLLFVNKTRGF